MKIVFVCLGNICRSPLAEGIAKHLYSGDKLVFSSAGTSGFHNGESVDSRSIAVAKAHNIDISHYTSKQVSVYGHSDVDLFVAMDRQNIANLIRLGFEPQKIKLLGDFGLGGVAVMDPYYAGGERFEEVYKLLESGIKNLLQEFA
ncbi:low molecular weight protein-tyrosine-phosphatase [uncultured Helicobacter sp.]|uniref:low molecular weight protein-tyrosine-phosphatase n=1 Tax=uncultured Helicobacter sp. TaxID=175537 RepID=UPI0025983444|nr:low molecular weight protein-tyrosine-phosphatase [uncultured Helicobacter sp.]